MLRRMSGVGGVVVVLAGCGPIRPPQRPTYDPDPEIALQLATVTQKICTDDKTNCDDPNGTGVYAAEGGAVGMGDAKAMITHFINDGGSVKVEGRYFNSSAGAWSRYTSNVEYAIYNHQLADVVSITESSTEVKWQLRDQSDQNVYTVPDHDHSLADLAIYVSGSAGTPRAGISFQARDSSTTPGHQSLTRYDVMWSTASDQVRDPQLTPYCLDALGRPDPVVFQQGIDVDPSNGRVQTANAANVVTMSCSLGAPAMVYSWGYSYQPPKAAGVAPTVPFYFAAAIQMKRASYCGNGTPYTVAGTRIYIADDEHIQPLKSRPDKVSDIEAWWTPDGAKCVNLSNLRHVSLGFKGSCDNKPLPPCHDLPSKGAAYLTDAPEYPGAK